MNDEARAIAKQKTAGPSAMLPWVPIRVGMEVPWAGAVFVLSEVHPEDKELTLGYVSGVVKYSEALRPGTEVKLAGAKFQIHKIVKPVDDNDPWMMRLRWIAPDSRNEDTGSMMRRLMDAPRRK